MPPIKAVRETNEACVLMERAVVVNGSDRAAEDDAGDKKRSVVRTRVDRIIGINDGVLLRHGHRADQEHNKGQRRVSQHHFTVRDTLRTILSVASLSSSARSPE